MAHNFHDNQGWLIFGVEGHMGIHWPTPLPVPMFFWSATFAHPFTMGGNQKPNVMLNGNPSVVDKHEPKFLWPHIGFIPDFMDLLTPLHLAFGSQQCWLPRLAVHICGTPAAPTVIGGPASVNLDCWEFCKLPTSFILQPGTVQTTPSPEDYKYGAIRYAVDAAIDLALFFATGGLNKKGAFVFGKAGIREANERFQREAVQAVRDKLLSDAGKEGMDNITRELWKPLRDKVLGKLWDPPSGKVGWADFARKRMQDLTGFNPAEFAAAAATGQDLPDLKFDPKKALEEATKKIIPVTGPAKDGYDLLPEQQRQAEQDAWKERQEALLKEKQKNAGGGGSW
jgi:hypothetical protein